MSIFDQINSEGQTEFAMIEQWESKEDLDNHMKTEHVKQFLEKGSKEVVDGKPVISLYKTCGM